MQPRLDREKGNTMRVPVLDTHRTPLMPTTPARVRLLLKQGRAKPYWNKIGIFCIILTYEEVYDLCDDIHRARWRKVHALAVRLVGADPIEALPDNLLAAERDYLNSVIRIREIREQG